MESDQQAQQLLAIRDSLWTRCRRDGYAGYDPFDFLNSRLFQATPFHRLAFLRLAWLQLGKRLPVNLRPLLGVSPRRNPKGIALFVLGLCEEYQRTGEPSLLEEAGQLSEWLLEEACNRAEWGGYCWGYHFDWQARAFFVPRGTPNIITTTYVARALEQAGRLSGRGDLLEAAYDAARFMVNSLLDKQGGSPFFAYIPGESAFVHNASLWGAAWCVHAGRECGDAGLVDVGSQVARSTLACQRPDGSWEYGTLPHHRFVDGFHTGYNLEALDMIARETGDVRVAANVDRGFSYYRQHLFEPDATPRYYAGQLYPIDMHSFSQAVIVLLRVRPGLASATLCHRVMERAVSLLYRPAAGLFAYQRNRLFVNRVNYMRWTQAWAFLAINIYLRSFLREPHAAG